MYFSDMHQSYLLYNSLSNSFIAMGEDIYNNVLNIKKKPNQIDENVNSDLMSILKDMMVIYEGTDDDILNILRLKYYQNCFQSKSLMLTIAPTLDCNFKCPYCYENDHKSSIYMDDTTQNLLIQFIKNKYEKGNFKKVFIDWYGGEPLLAFDRIQSITKALKEHQIEFQSDIITNGYLLTKEIIELLPDLNIKWIQISIDGDASTHNKSRPHIINNDSYEKIMQNLKILHNFLQKQEHKFSVSIRYQVDKNNEKCFDSIAELFVERFPLFVLYPSMVQCGIGNSTYTEAQITLNSKEHATFLRKHCNKGKNVLIRCYPEWVGATSCIAAIQNGYVIGPEGEIYRCWEDVGNKELIMGNIHHNSGRLDNLPKLARFMAGIDPTLEKSCSSCLFLPTCGGGCPGKRMKNKYENGNYHLCTYFKGEEETKAFLDIHYARQKAEKSQESIFIGNN